MLCADAKDPVYKIPNDPAMEKSKAVVPKPGVVDKGFILERNDFRIAPYG